MKIPPLETMLSTAGAIGALGLAVKMYERHDLKGVGIGLTLSALNATTAYTLYRKYTKRGNI